MSSAKSEEFPRRAVEVARLGMNLEQFQALPVGFGKGSFKMSNLLDDWASRVLKFLGDCQVDIGNELTWSMADLIGAFHLRDGIEREVRMLEEPPQSAVLPAIDALYRSFTSEVKISEIAGWEPDGLPQDLGWWWTRVPTNGPVRREFNQNLD